MITVTRALGHHTRPYVVAQFRGGRMRISHCVDLTEAAYVRAEWERADFTFHPGDLRSPWRLN